MNLITSFSKTALKSERFKNWFVSESPQDKTVTRSKEPMKLLKDVKCRTQRYQKSRVPFMTKLLFWQPPLPAPHLELT